MGIGVSYAQLPNLPESVTMHQVEYARICVVCALDVGNVLLPCHRLCHLLSECLEINCVALGESVAKRNAIIRWSVGSDATISRPRRDSGVRFSSTGTLFGSSTPASKGHLKFHAVSEIKDQETQAPCHHHTRTARNLAANRIDLKRCRAKPRQHDGKSLRANVEGGALCGHFVRRGFANGEATEPLLVKRS